MPVVCGVHGDRDEKEYTRHTSTFQVAAIPNWLPLVTLNIQSQFSSSDPAHLTCTSRICMEPSPERLLTLVTPRSPLPWEQVGGRQDELPNTAVQK